MQEREWMSGSRERMREHSACVGCVVEMHRRRGGSWESNWHGPNCERERVERAHTQQQSGELGLPVGKEIESEWANKHSACACYAGMAKRRESLKTAGFGQKVAEEKIGRSGWRNRGRALHSWFCLFSLPGAPPISQQNWFVYTKLVFLLKTAFSFHNKLALFSQNSCFGAKNGLREDWQIRMEEQG